MRNLFFLQEQLELLSAYRQKILFIALGTLGLPSIRYMDPNEGINPAGFDCSGWVKFVIGLAQADIPELLFYQDLRHADQMFDHLGIPVHTEKIQPADLVFYSLHGDRPTHIAMFLGKDTDGRKLIIHAPGKKNGRVEINFINYYGEVIPHNNGTIYEYNPIGFKRLTLKVTHHRRHQEPLP
jgi:cell wall-associated NlpC family hydrolase